MRFIIVTAVADGATVAFPKDQAVIADLKESFPKARWNPTLKHWYVPGVRAASRLAVWAEKHEPVYLAAEQKRRDLEFEGIEADPAKALAKRAGEIKSRNAKVEAGRVVYSFRYSEGAVAVARALPGARFDGGARSWSFRPSSLVDVDTIIAGCNEIRTITLAVEAGAAEQKAVEHARREAARLQAVAESRAGSEVWIKGTEPALNRPFHHRGKVVVATRISGPFKVDTDAILVNGGCTLDEEWCVRVWLRDGTEDEAAPLNVARQEAELAKAEATARDMRVQAKTDEARIASGRPIHVGLLVGMEMIERMGIGQAVWHPEVEFKMLELPPLPPRIDYWELSYEEAEQYAAAMLGRAPDDHCPELLARREADNIRRQIARFKIEAALLSDMTPDQHLDAERQVSENFRIGAEAFEKLWNMD